MENQYFVNQNKNNTIDVNNYYTRNRRINNSFDKYGRNGVTLHNLYNKFLILKYPNPRNRRNYNNTTKSNTNNNINNNNDFNNENNNNLNSQQYYNDLTSTLNRNNNEENKYNKLQEEKPIKFSNRTPNIQQHAVRIGYTPNKINQPYQLSNEIQYQEINDKNNNIYTNNYNNNCNNKNNDYNNNFNNNCDSNNNNYNNNCDNNNYNNNDYNNNYHRKILSTPIKNRNYNYYKKSELLDQDVDECSRSSKNKGYLSPVISNIAKHYYLSGNPYSDKNEDLGPSNLKVNPIVYPIDSYRFDFNRYIRGDYVKKFV